LNPKPNQKPNGVRTLHADLTANEFNAVRWAAKRAGQPPHKAIPLASFFRRGVGNLVHKVVREEISADMPVPPNVAATIDHEFKD